MRRSLHGSYVLSSLVLLLALLLTTVPVGAQATATARPTGVPGEFEFTAEGFRDDEAVSTWITGPSQQVMATPGSEADNRGRVRFRLRLPRHLEPGWWAITIHGLESNHEAITYFELPLRGPDAILAVNPPQAPAGSPIVVTGAGFEAREMVSYWLTAPSGAVYFGGYTLATSDGQVNFAYRIGAATERGAWRLTVYGLRSDRLGIAPFMVTEPA